jgi:hypothetical protein
MVKERSAISKNINNTLGFDQPLISYEPVVYSFNQAPLPPVGAVNFAAKQGPASKSIYPGRAGLQSAVRMSTALNATPDGTNDDTEIEEEVVIKKAETPDADAPVKLTNYSWIVLGMICAVRICYQWMRSIFSYSYGYTGIGA